MAERTIAADANDLIQYAKGGEYIPPSCRERVADLLDNKSRQLEALLSQCHGAGQQWFDEMGSYQRHALMWLAADLARDIREMAQVVTASNSTAIC